MCLFCERGLLPRPTDLVGESLTPARAGRGSGLWLQLPPNQTKEGRDKLMGVIGVSSIFTTDCCCDAGVELSMRFILISLSRLALDGTPPFITMKCRLKRFHVF